MKKLYLIKNPELFQGEKYLKKNDSYFEGWYFKNTNGKDGISFIPGISIDKNGKKAFIQIITNNSSFFVNYSINDFKFNINPFYVKIGNNYFSKRSIHIDINDAEQNLMILGDIKYSNTMNISTNFFNPNIMGPFSFVTFMECNHAVLSMKSIADGLITLNDKEIKFNKGTAYIEKDFGYSFPKSYIWCQGNNFKNFNSSFMFSIADIPFMSFHFQGIICSLIIDDIEYRFATYNGAKVVKCDVNDNFLNIVLKKDSYYLNIKSKYGEGLRLAAPVKGKMKKDIFESISESVTVTLKKKGNIIFRDTSTNCGLEIVNDEYVK